MAKKQRERKEPVNDIKTILENTDKISHQQLMTNLRKSKFQIEFKNDSQKKLWDLIDKHEITLCSGPAGTGKSYISVAKAIDLVFRENSVYKKIIIVKPLTEAGGEKLGFLPGDIMEKMSPYIYSTLYLFEKMIGKKKTDMLLKADYIRPIPIAYMRGITLDSCVIIVEEAQNMTNPAMKTLLTRIGENSKMVISGDLEQSDLFKSEKETGLYNAINKLKDMDEIGCVEFTENDIVRNALIGKILKKLNGDFN